MSEEVLERAECDAQELGRVDVAEPKKAAQSIPPKVRRAVLRRHGGRCAVPGCRHGAFVEVRHVERRADGGGHDADNLIVLCGAHHEAVHSGALVVRGSYSTGYRFEHADGRDHGAPQVAPARAVVLAQALSLLVGLGFKQREAQAMVDRARADLDPIDDPCVEQAVRAALRHAVLPSSVVREAYASYRRAA